MKPEFITFRINSNLRHYTYKVKVTTNTGRVVHLRAGCRYWQSFYAARRWYSAETSDTMGFLSGPKRWSDEWIARQTKDQQEKLRGDRREANAIIDKLEERVQDYQRKRRQEKRKKRN